LNQQNITLTRRYTLSFQRAFDIFRRNDLTLLHLSHTPRESNVNQQAMCDSLRGTFDTQLIRAPFFDNLTLLKPVIKAVADLKVIKSI